MLEPARDNRNDDASDYDKYCTYAYPTIVTVVTDASDHRRRLLSRERGGLKAVTCAAVIASLLVNDDLRRGLAQFKLVTHFLKARSKRFNLLLLLHKLRLKVLR